MTLRRTLAALLLLALLGVALLACGEGQSADSQDGGPTADLVAGDDVPEVGEGQVFWRTQDGFESLTAGEPYKVVARVTNGYAEPTLRIVAEPFSEGESVEFQANLATPAGPDEAGSYYVFSLNLPTEGSWQMSAYVSLEPAMVLVSVDP